MKIGRGKFGQSANLNGTNISLHTMHLVSIESKLVKYIVYVLHLVTNALAMNNSCQFYS